MIKSIATALLILLMVYLAILLAFYLLQVNILFHPEKLPTKYKFDTRKTHEEFLIETSDHAHINAMLFPGKSDQVILYLHGNSGSLRSWQGIHNTLADLEHALFIIDYRGFGKSSGQISQEGLFLDAISAHKFLIDKGYEAENIIIYGRSIGTAVAIDLASKVKCKALMLESPFLDMGRLIKSKIPFFPHDLLLKFPFDSKLKIAQIKAPILVIFGMKDKLIPKQFSLQLADAIESQKSICPVEGANHNNISLQEQYLPCVQAFLQGLD
jgi:pimeloyl-ACP methyl ester carboxylesterase